MKIIRKFFKKTEKEPAKTIAPEEFEKFLEEVGKKPSTIKDFFKECWWWMSDYIPHLIKNWWRSVCRFFRNIKKYWKVLREDNDFDYGYLEDIMLTKLEAMADYFRVARISADSETVYSQINRFVQLGKVAFGKEDFGEENNWEFPGYINIKNSNRIRGWEWLSKPEKNLRYFSSIKTDYREEKARMIFWKYIGYYIPRWWD